MTTKKSEKQVKDMSAKERLLLLRINARHGGDEKKRLQGKVSEAKTDFKNTLKAAVPDDGEEAKARLRRLQLLDEECDSRKKAKAAFGQRIKDTQHALLYSEISEGGQLVLPGAELQLAPENLRELRQGIADVKLQDAAVRSDGEEEPKHPLENEADLAALDAELTRFIAAANITPASLGAAPTAAEAKAESKRGKEKAPPPAPPVH